MRFGELRASLWLSVAHCVARSVIVVAGKFASIFDLRLRFEFLAVRDFSG